MITTSSGLKSTNWVTLPVRTSSVTSRANLRGMAYQMSCGAAMDNSFIVQSSPNLPNIIGSCTPHQSLTTHKLLKKAADYYQTILNYRNTPLEGSESPPAGSTVDREQIKDNAPQQLQHSFTNKAQQKWSKPSKKGKRKKISITTSTASLHNGDDIRMQKGEKWESETVLYKHQLTKSFVVKTPGGSWYNINWRQLYSSQAPLQKLGRVLCHSIYRPNQPAAE